MLGWFRRPNLDVSFSPTQAATDEFARQLALAGRLLLTNEGAPTEIDDVEMMVIAGFRRIPLEVPVEWRAVRLGTGERKEGLVEWTLTLDAPLRVDNGELAVTVRDQRRKRWEWRLPFAFERR